MPFSEVYEERSSTNHVKQAEIIANETETVKIIHVYTVSFMKRNHKLPNPL